MKKSTRVLSLLLVLVMVFALMPTFAIEAKAAGEFDADYMYDKSTLEQQLLQFKKIRNTTGAGENYHVNTTYDRHVLYYGDGVDLEDWGYGDSNLVLVRYNSGTIYYDRGNPQRLRRTNNHGGTTDHNRWWRWDSDTKSWGNTWTDSNTTAGFFARIRGDIYMDGTTDWKWVPIVKNNDTTYSRRHDETYRHYTGGERDQTGGSLELKINATSDLTIGNKAVLWSANGSRWDGLILDGKQSYLHENDPVKTGDIGTHTFVVAESRKVVYDLDGGTWTDDEGKTRTGTFGFYCWTTGDKVTSQLHDIIGGTNEPTREGYTFLGWQCVEPGDSYVDTTTKMVETKISDDAYLAEAVIDNPGTALVKNNVYQPSKNENNCITVLGNVKFKALWAKDTFNIAHVQNGKLNSTVSVNMSDYGEYVAKDENSIKEFQYAKNLDIVGETTRGYLYGGTFAEEACTTPATAEDLFNGGDAKSFNPKGGATYYIWEVPTQHLQPTILGVFENEGGNYNVIEAYAVSAIDRLQYQEAGFIVNGNKYISKDSDVKALFKKIAVKSTKSGGSRDYTYNQLNSKFTDVKSDALLSCISFPVPATGSTSTVVPYWITLDGQTVYGIKQAMVQYNGAGSAYKNMALTVAFDDYHGILQSFPAPRMSASPMMLMSTFSMNMSSAPEPDEIGETVEPDEPDEPEVPDVPVVPDEPEVKAMLNIVDGDKAYEVEISDDMALTATGQDGKLFGGWFADEGCTIPANISKAQDGNTVYAKYVSDKYLQVKYNAVFTLLSKSVSLTSAVDSKDYAETGYVISTKGGDKTVVVSKYATTFALQNAKQLFGVEKNAPLMNVDYKLSGLSKNDTVTITPYWVTADGTTVYGTARTLTYTGLTMRG